LTSDLILETFAGGLVSSCDLDLARFPGILYCVVVGWFFLFLHDQRCVSLLIVLRRSVLCVLLYYLVTWYLQYCCEMLCSTTSYYQVPTTVVPNIIVYSLHTSTGTTLELQYSIF
jgi:hypothetical protein